MTHEEWRRIYDPIARRYAKVAKLLDFERFKAEPVSPQAIFFAPERVELFRDGALTSVRSARVEFDGDMRPMLARVTVKFERSGEVNFPAARAVTFATVKVELRTHEELEAAFGAVAERPIIGGTIAELFASARVEGAALLTILRDSRENTRRANEAARAYVAAGGPELWKELVTTPAEPIPF